jgi:hypothetical protein
MAPTPSISYQYSPLEDPEDSIRILQITPSQNRDEPIHCTVSQERLSDPGLIFEALSYTWGNPEKTASILVGDNKASLVVTMNCFQALVNLRLPDASRAMWIDAVCINQEDIPERSSQVRIMDSIFGKAVETIIYLGEETSSSRIVFAELAEAAKAGKAMAKLWADYDEEYPKPNRPRPSTEVVEALDNLLLRPWFRRVWVLQEVYASKSRRFMCGSNHAHWNELQDCLMGYSGTRVTKQFLPIIFHLRHMEYQQSPNIWYDLWKRLIDTRAVSATDGRDRIFALKAFLGKDRKEMSELINYSMDIRSLFAKVAELLLGSVKLLLLTAARHPHNFPQNDFPPNPESSPASRLQTMAAGSRTESSPSPLCGPLELDGAQSRSHSVVSSTSGVDTSEND